MHDLCLLLRDLVFCFLTTLTFAFLMSAPLRAKLLSAGIATAGYLIYDIFIMQEMSVLLAFFAGTVVIAVLAEVTARLAKMPATLFIYPAVIPLVPGLGLHQTMLCLMQGDYAGFGQTGTQTALIAGVMAAGVAIVNLTVRVVFYRRKR